MTRTLPFYFDFISHNAYLAWVRLPALAERHDVVFEPVPVVFGALLQAHGQLGPAEVRPKALWMLRDVVRKAKREGVPIAPPHSHPFNPLPTLRAASVDLPAAERARLVDVLFAATWAERRNVGEPDEVARVLDAAGFDGSDLMARAQSDAGKQRLRAQTDAALEHGVFGVPSFRVGDALFWGYDDLASLDEHLAGRDPVADEDFEAWAAVSPSIVRRR